MGDKSKIEWTDASWTPIRAKNQATGKVGWFCSHASPGCELCYAEAMNARLGTGVAFKAQNRDDVEIYLDETMLQQPLHWRRPRRIFVCSMTDLFGEFVTDAMISKVFAIMAVCPQHTFIVLTKRAQRMRDYMEETTGLYVLGEETAWPLPNVWLGVSVEDQRRADERIPNLLQSPAAVRFVSAEPLLRRLDLKVWLAPAYEGDRRKQIAVPRIDWIIVGGESGAAARPFDLMWAGEIINECERYDVPVFVKQIGRRPLIDGAPYLAVEHPKGGEPTEWPRKLRVREWPKALAR